MVEINRLKVHRFPEVSDAETPDDLQTRLIIEVEGYDSEEDLYEIIENDTESEDYDYDSVIDDSSFDQTNLDSLSKVQAVLDQISLSVSRFMRQKVESMERNIFRINNGAPPEVQNVQDIPMDVRMVAYLLAQGDNRNVEELLRSVHQNVVVNVNLSYYFKIMLVMLTFNTLLLFKWMVWDRLE